MAGIRIIGLGSSTGDKVVTNDMMAQIVDTSDQWIREKSGIRSRYFAENKTNAQMASEAARKAIEDAQVNPDEIGYLIVCTFTPDHLTPAVACSVSRELGLNEEIMALDLNGACTGFIFGCKMADGLLSKDQGKYALVIGSEKISPVMDMQDRSTCVLFGDGAGAAVLEYSQDSQFAFYSGCQPRVEVLNCTRENPAIYMSGQEVYRFAVSMVPRCIEKVMEKAQIEKEDVDWFVCHQANERIIDNAARRIKNQEEKFYKNLYSYGNTSAASIPLALSDMAKEGLLEEKKTAVCTGFGAGLTYASMVIEIKR